MILKKNIRRVKIYLRPKHWSGWCLDPESIEFWLGDKYRIHERLKYIRFLNNWKKEILYP